MQLGEGVDMGAVFMGWERQSPASWTLSVRVVVELDFVFEISYWTGVGAWAWVVDGVWGPAEGAVGGDEVMVFDDELVVCCCEEDIAGVCAQEMLAPEDAADAGGREGLGDVVDCAVRGVFVGWAWHLGPGMELGSAPCSLRVEGMI